MILNTLTNTPGLINILVLNNSSSRQSIPNIQIFNRLTNNLGAIRAKRSSIRRRNIKFLLANRHRTINAIFNFRRFVTILFRRTDRFMRFNQQVVSSRGSYRNFPRSSYQHQTH